MYFSKWFQSHTASSRIISETNTQRLWELAAYLFHDLGCHPAWCTHKCMTSAVTCKVFSSRQPGTHAKVCNQFSELTTLQSWSVLHTLQVVEHSIMLDHFYNPTGSNLWDWAAQNKIHWNDEFLHPGGSIESLKIFSFNNIFTTKFVSNGFYGRCSIRFRVKLMHNL